MFFFPPLKGVHTLFKFDYLSSCCSTNDMTGSFRIYSNCLLLSSARLRRFTVKACFLGGRYGKPDSTAVSGESSLLPIAAVSFFFGRKKRLNWDIYQPLLFLWGLVQLTTGKDQMSGSSRDHGKHGIEAQECPLFSM